jgi:hypothetical protein
MVVGQWPDGDGGEPDDDGGGPDGDGGEPDDDGGGPDGDGGGPDGDGGQSVGDGGGSHGDGGGQLPGVARCGQNAVGQQWPAARGQQIGEQMQGVVGNFSCAPVVATVVVAIGTWCGQQPNQ